MEEGGREKIKVRVRGRDKNPAHYGWLGKGPQAKECGTPLERGKKKPGNDSSPEPPEKNAPLMTP